MSVELNKVLDAFINHTRVRIELEDKTKAWRTVPAIWDQLISSAQWGNGEGGSSKFGSRPVIATGVVSLVHEITTAVAETADELKVTRWDHHQSPCLCQPPAICDPRKWRTHNTPKELRAIAATQKDAEQLNWWTEKITNWISQARQALNVDPPLGQAARGATCPACGEAHAYIKLGPKEYSRVPTLAILWKRPEGDDYHADDEWRVGAVECRNCFQTWARGETLHNLYDQMIAANLTRETMTDGVA